MISFMRLVYHAVQKISKRLLLPTLPQNEYNQDATLHPNVRILDSNVEEEFA